MPTGKIKTLKDFYGFIAVDGQSQDIFFHGTGLKEIKFGDLLEGQNVKFETIKTPKGFKAIDIEITETQK
jgi:CspA family cold shock protein